MYLGLKTVVVRVGFYKVGHIPKGMLEEGRTLETKCDKESPYGIINKFPLCHSRERRHSQAPVLSKIKEPL